MMSLPQDGQHSDQSGQQAGVAGGLWRTRQFDAIPSRV